MKHATIYYLLLILLHYLPIHLTKYIKDNINIIDKYIYICI